MKHLLFSILAIFATVNSFAEFRYKIALPEVDKDGFYAVDLPYFVLGKMQANLADIRMLDNETQQEIAYIIKENIDEYYNSEFIPFSITIEKQGKETNVIIATEGKKVSSFTLRIKNADINKVATLQGSNDKQKWYGVKDEFWLRNNYTQNQPETLIDIHFPLSDYQYYKLIVNDSLTAPLNILSVGTIKNRHNREKHFLQIPIAEQTIKTKDKITEIQLVFDNKFLISKLELYVSNPQYFSREIVVCCPTLYKIHNGKRKQQYMSYASPIRQTISSKNDERVFTIDYNHRTDTLLLSIQNGDDQPLTIDSIKAFTKNMYLAVFLQEGKSYSLVYGNSSAVLPRYDLTFANNLPEEITHISPSANVEEINSPAEEKTSSALLDFMKTYGLWIIILLVIGQVLYMVWRMTKQK